MHCAVRRPPVELKWRWASMMVVRTCSRLGVFFTSCATCSSARFTRARASLRTSCCLAKPSGSPLKASACMQHRHDQHGTSCSRHYCNITICTKAKTRTPVAFCPAAYYSFQQTQKAPFSLKKQHVLYQAKEEVQYYTMSDAKQHQLRHVRVLV